VGIISFCGCHLYIRVLQSPKTNPLPSSSEPPVSSCQFILYRTVLPTGISPFDTLVALAVHDNQQGPIMISLMKWKWNPCQGIRLLPYNEEDTLGIAFNMDLSLGYTKNVTVLRTLLLLTTTWTACGKNKRIIWKGFYMHSRFLPPKQHVIYSQVDGCPLNKI
jgi:hypothetical protein